MIDPELVEVEVEEQLPAFHNPDKRRREGKGDPEQDKRERNGAGRNIQRKIQNIKLERK